MFPQDADSSAFTLIDLLVIIAIFAGLASLLLPGLSQGKGEAQGSACSNSLMTLAWTPRIFFPRLS